MSERSLWQWLAGVLPPAGHFTRIESPCSPGFPDVHYSLQGRTGTLELKFSKHPNSNHPFNPRDGLRQAQLNWIRDQVRAGGQVWIVAEVSPQIFFVGGQYAPRFNHYSLPELAAASSLIILKGLTPRLTITAKLESLLLAGGEKSR